MGQLIDLGKIMKRLGLIKELILLEEFVEIKNHTEKLKGISNRKLEIIIKNLESEFYSDAISNIEAFINEHLGLFVYEDSEVESLKIEIKKLEIEIGAISGEITETEKLIHDFGVRHSKELGGIINEILKYRKDRAEREKDESKEKKSAFDEAKEDYDNHSKQYNENILENQFVLNEEEQIELKSKYRKASKLCHPDLVTDEQKENAEIIFIDLQKAYEKNNLKKVLEIYEMLLKGDFFINKSDDITEKVKLKAELIKLRNKVNDLRMSLDELINSETFQSIMKIDDWDIYFIETKVKLNEELESI